MKDEAGVLYPNEQVATAVLAYCRQHSVTLPDHIYKHAKYTNEELGDWLAEMMVSPLQAQYLLWTAKALGAKRILEIGCFTGFSALAFGEALKDVDGGKIITTDINPKTCEIARQAFKDAGIDSFTTVIEGPALDSLRNLDNTEQFDLVFLDADKEGYPDYFNLLMELKLIRKGGILIADNVLKKGLVADSSEINPASTESNPMQRVPYLLKFNELIAKDPRVETLLVPVFDGLAQARVL